MSPKGTIQIQNPQQITGFEGWSGMQKLSSSVKPLYSYGAKVKVTLCFSVSRAVPVYICVPSTIINGALSFSGKKEKNVSVWIIDSLVTLVTAWTRSHGHSHC